MSVKPGKLIALYETSLLVSKFRPKYFSSPGSSSRWKKESSIFTSKHLNILRAGFVPGWQPSERRYLQLHSYSLTRGTFSLGFQLAFHWVERLYVKRAKASLLTNGGPYSRDAKVDDDECQENEPKKVPTGSPFSRVKARNLYGHPLSFMRLENTCSTL